MSKLTDLQRMQQIVQAQYEQKQQYFQTLTARETHLRAELDRLSAQARETGCSDLALQSIGADILWRGWVGRAKTQLNIELAQTLALKRHHQAEVRQAYGKVLVVEELIAQLQENARKVQAAKTLQVVLDQHLQNDGHGIPRKS